MQRDCVVKETGNCTTLIDSSIMIHKCIETERNPCIDRTVYIYRDKGVQRYRDTGVQGYRAIGIQGYRDTGVQGYRDTGIH